MDLENLTMDLGSDDDLSFDISQVDDVELPDALASNLGISDSADIFLGDVDLDLDEVADSESEEDGISAAVLVKTNVVVVDALRAYAQRANEAITIFSARQPEIDKDKFVVNPSEFNYIPQDVFVPFYNILVDMACDPEYQNTPIEECAEKSLGVLYDATHWYPKLYKPEYIQSFCNWCGRFRKLAQVRTQVSKSDIFNLISKQELEVSLNVFQINTEPFEILNNFFNDAAASASAAELDPDSLGEFTKDYMSRMGLRVFTVKDAYAAILGYFGSDDTMQALKLTQDELLELSNGELLRQLILFELNSGFLYPTGIRGCDPNNLSAMITMLSSAIASGSIVAEIIYIAATMMLATSKESRPENMEAFLAGMLHFFLAFLEDPAYVNPVFYGHVQHLEDEYILSYVVGEDTYTVQSKDLLCDVIGDKTSTYCIPKVLIDNTTGHAICPPPNLVTPLRAIANGGRMKVAGAVCFKFSPTVNWLLVNKILAEEQKPEENVVTDTLQSTTNSLLQMLISYDNKFASQGGNVSPVIVSANGYTIYSAGSNAADGSYPIAVVMDSNQQLVSTVGALVRDSETDNVIVSFTTVSGNIEEFVAEQGKYQEDYLGTSADKEVEEISLSDFLLGAQSVSEIPYMPYRKAVQRLCSLAALDYSEELEAVQTVIARDLYYVMCVPMIDSLVASRVLQVYLQFIEERNAEGVQPALDPFNVPSFQELADIVLGKPNAYSGFTGWNAEFSQVLKEHYQELSLEVKNVCDQVDALDFDKIALQVLSRGELRREVNMDAYYAYHYIPAIGTRLCQLEDKMIAMRVLSVLGDQVLSVFSKRSFLCRAYTSQLMLENIETVNAILKEKSKLSSIDFALPMSKEVLSTKQSPDIVVLKYFILERNIYGLLSAMQTAGGEYDGDYYAFLEELGLPKMTDVSAMSPAEFDKQAGPDRVAQLCSKYRERLKNILQDGLLNETIGNNGLQLVKAYDLFNSFHDFIVGIEMDDDEGLSLEGTEIYREPFIRYVGSLVVSYCPVVDSSAGDIDGGVDRVAAFIKTPKDFVYNAPIDYLRGYDLQDVRTIITE